MLVEHLLADIVVPHPLEGGLVGGGHLRVLRLHGEQFRLGLRLDQAERARGGAGALMPALLDDEGTATGAAM